MSHQIDFLIVGLGNPEPQYVGTRHNAGFIFIDYLANAIRLSSGNPGSNEESETIPVFIRRHDIGADIKETQWEISTGPIRIVLAKPFTSMNVSGEAVQRLIALFGLSSDIKKKLIVVCDDLNTLPGSLTIQNGGTLRSLAGHKGVESICNTLGTTDFVRFRLGIGRPLDNMPIPDYVLSKISHENKEMNLFGYVLEQTTAALADLAQHGDFKKVHKKYGTSKKIPKQMPEMISLEFSIRILEDRTLQ